MTTDVRAERDASGSILAYGLVTAMPDAGAATSSAVTARRAATPATLLAIDATSPAEAP